MTLTDAGLALAVVGVLGTDLTFVLITVALTLGVLAACVFALGFLVHILIGVLHGSHHRNA